MGVNYGPISPLKKANLVLYRDFVKNPNYGLGPNIKITRSTTATRFNKDGFLEIVPINTERIDYDPIAKKSKGLLIESERTNSFTYSSDYANAIWTKNSSSVSLYSPGFYRDFINDQNINGSSKIGPDISFERVGNGTYFDNTGTLKIAGHNLLTYSQDFSNSLWNKKNSVIQIADISETVAPDESNTATKVTEGAIGTAGVAHGLQIMNTYSLNKIENGRMFSFYAKRKTATDWIRLTHTDAAGNGREFYINLNTGAMQGNIDQGTPTTNPIEKVIALSNGWYRILSYFESATSGSGGLVNIYLSNSAGTNPLYTADGSKSFYIWGAQWENAYSLNSPYVPTTSSPVYTPRFDYDQFRKESKGLLVEEARTNSIKNSQNIGAVNGVLGSGGSLPTNWSSTLKSFSGMDVQVVGTGTEWGLNYIDLRIYGTTVSQTIMYHNINFNDYVTVSNSQTWSNSVYFRPISVASGSNINWINLQCGIFDSSNNYLGEVGNTTLPKVYTTTFNRYSFSGTINNASANKILPYFQIRFIAANQPVDITLRIAAPQLEFGNVATSYIPTYGVASKRNSENIDVSSISSFYNSAESTILSEFSLPNLWSTQRGQFALSDGTNNNYIFLYTQPSAISASGFTTGTQNVFSQSTTLNTIDTVYKHAVAFRTSNDWQYCYNGTLAASITNQTVMSTATNLRIGRYGSSTGYLNGHLRRITYYPTRLSDSRLQSLTTSFDLVNTPDNVNSKTYKIIVTPGIGNIHGISYTSSLLANTVYTLSVFAKAADYSWISLTSSIAPSPIAYFNISTGTIGTTSNIISTSINNIGNGWYRCSMTWTNTSAGNADLNIRINSLDNQGTWSINGTGTLGTYFFGAQLEAGYFPSSYIPTTTSALTRERDNINIDSNYSSEGSFLVDAVFNANINEADGSQFLFDIYESTTAYVCSGTSITPDLNNLIFFDSGSTLNGQQVYYDSNNLYQLVYRNALGGGFSWVIEPYNSVGDGNIYWLKSGSTTITGTYFPNNAIGQLSVSSNTGRERLKITRTNSTGYLNYENIHLNISSSISGTTPIQPRVINKIALAYKNNDFIIYLNGSSQGAITSVITFDKAKTIKLGSPYTNDNTFYLNGYIRKIAQTSNRLSNSDLSKITL